MAETRRRHPNGDSYCSACKKMRYDNFRLTQPERVARYRRVSWLRRQYGVDAEAVERPCDICGREWETGRRHHVDHDHDSGEVRGVLCHGCNTGLGLLGEENMEAALAYLRKAGKSKKR